MKATAIPRTSALRLAWNLVREAGLSFSVAQRKAWASLNLRRDMATRSTSFFYEKGDGEVRFAVGNYTLAPATKTPVDLSGAVSGLTIKYYDTLAAGWRSFRADRLLL